jgi:histidine ammonia-lyase
LASENRAFAPPASADSIPTSLGQEDHVSMGSISARKTLRIIENLEKILSIELITAAQGFDFRKPLKSGVLIDEAHSFIRKHISFADKDRIYLPDIEEAIDLIKSKQIIHHLNKIALKNKIDFKNEEHEVFGIY